MSSISGYLTYLRFTTGPAKGETPKNSLVADPWSFGDIKERVDYTGSRVVEAFDSITSGTTKVAWTPVAGQNVVGTALEAKAIGADGNEIRGTGDVPGVTLAEDGTITVAEGVTASDIKKIAYCYNNIVIPQAQLPVIKASMEMIPLQARARRIAVAYSQIAAFESKTDYGRDLGDDLSTRAQAELSYEIDAEICNMLSEAAGDAVATTTFSKVIPVGVSKAEHYQGFLEVIDAASTIVYNATQRFVPNYMLCARDVLNVLTFINGWVAAPATSISGPYFAGTLNGLKVFVSPTVESGRFILGVNNNEMNASAACYCPYMAIVPTQLLGYADGTMSQGFSTLYDAKILNKQLLVAGKITTDGTSTTAVYGVVNA